MNNAFANCSGNNLASGTAASSAGIYLYLGSNDNNAFINTTAFSNLSSGYYIANGNNELIDCQGKSLIGTNSSSTYGI